MRILIFLSTPAHYFLECFEFFVKRYNPENFCVIYKPINKYVPYGQYIKKYSYQLLLIEELEKGIKLKNFIFNFNPDLIYVPGWIYPSILWHAINSKCKVVMGMDTILLNSLKQKFWVIIFNKIFRPKLTAIWTTGRSLCFKYAKLLSDRQVSIYQGLYCANVSMFGNNKNKKIHEPVRILYLGRLSEEKGILNLLKAYNLLMRNSINSRFDLELWISGDGPLREVVEKSSYLKYLGYIPPGDIPQLFQEVDFLIMPSIYDRWGVAVHEACAAGVPPLLSYNVGAKEWFLIEGKNGFLFSPYNYEDIAWILKKAATISHEKYQEMSYISRCLALTYTPEMWAETLLSIINS